MKKLKVTVIVETTDEEFERMCYDCGTFEILDKMHIDIPNVSIVDDERNDVEEID